MLLRKLVFDNSKHIQYPKLALFAKRTIPAGSEIYF